MCFDVFVPPRSKKRTKPRIVLCCFPPLPQNPREQRTQDDADGGGVCWDLTNSEGSEEIICGFVILHLHEELQREVQDARGEGFRLEGKPSTCLDEVAFDEIIVQFPRGRELGLRHRMDLVLWFEPFEIHGEHVREGVLVRRQLLAPGTEKEVIRGEGVFEVEAFDVSEDDGVENDEIGSDACLLHVRNRSGEFIGVFAAYEASHQVGERGGVKGSTLVGATLKPRFGVFQLPALNVSLDQIGEGLPLRYLAMVFHPGLNDVVYVGRRETDSVSKEAYELVKCDFRKFGVGQGVP